MLFPIHSLILFHSFLWNHIYSFTFNNSNERSLIDSHSLTPRTTCILSFTFIHSCNHIHSFIDIHIYCSSVVHFSSIYSFTDFFHSFLLSFLHMSFSDPFIWRNREVEVMHASIAGGNTAIVRPHIFDTKPRPGYTSKYSHDGAFSVSPLVNS